MKPPRATRSRSPPLFLSFSSSLLPHWTLFRGQSSEVFLPQMSRGCNSLHQFPKSLLFRKPVKFDFLDSYVVVVVVVVVVFVFVVVIVVVIEMMMHSMYMYCTVQNYLCLFQPCLFPLDWLTVDSSWMLNLHWCWRNRHTPSRSAWHPSWTDPSSCQLIPRIESCQRRTSHSKCHPCYHTSEPDCLNVIVQTHRIKQNQATMRQFKRSLPAQAVLHSVAGKDTACASSFSHKHSGPCERYSCLNT